MIFARTAESARTLASPRLDACCPSCAAPVVPKCGEIKVWHWAHLHAQDCDAWAEHETAWHLAWKARFPAEQTEVCLPPHRADIVTGDGRVIELQHSPIAPGEIREREAFYGDMLWVVDARPFLDHLVFSSRGSYHTFRWKWPRLSWLEARRPIYLDVSGDRLFAIRKLYAPASPKPCAGWGVYGTMQLFLARYGGVAA
jgi:hypothetical protein